ncbi:MAG: hypothetical protein AAB539_03730 [Patescibacteria group bacterium]
MAILFIGYSTKFKCEPKCKETGGDREADGRMKIIGECGNTIKDPEANG